MQGKHVTRSTKTAARRRISLHKFGKSNWESKFNMLTSKYKGKPQKQHIGTTYRKHTLILGQTNLIHLAGE